MPQYDGYRAVFTEVLHVPRSLFLEPGGNSMPPEIDKQQALLAAEIAAEFQQGSDSQYQRWLEVARSPSPTPSGVISVPVPFPYPSVDLGARAKVLVGNLASRSALFWTFEKETAGRLNTSNAKG